MNKLIIAAAGAGKTTYLVEKAKDFNSGSILITTYTQANEQEIRKKFFRKHGCIPQNVTIQTWFSFLIQHGIKPYQASLFDRKVRGLMLVNKQSGFWFKNKKGFPVYYGEKKHFDKHYFTKGGKVYSDKLSKLVQRINTKTKGKVINRISDIYTHIYIDEAQDLAGYDLEIIREFARSPSTLMMVCDPRQVTYLTHLERKFKKYRNGLLDQFILNECSGIQFDIDYESLSGSYRCNEEICKISNLLYPNLPKKSSLNKDNMGHDGIFVLEKDKLDDYLDRYKPVQLRWDSRNSDVNLSHPVYNFGASKGLGFKRVVIFPTKDMLNWLNDYNHELSDQARSKFYVALTRARYSAAILVDNIHDITNDDIQADNGQHQ